MATKMELADLELLDAPADDTQRVAVLEAPGRMSLSWAKIPEPGPGEVRVKIKYVGICGSDVEAYRGTRRPEFMSMPARLGHEVAGTIDAIGPGVGGLQLGDRVACRYVWGAFAQYIICRPFNVKVVPPSMPMKEVSLIEVLPGVIHAADLAEITPSKHVLITGQGVSGLVLTQVFSLCSPRSLVVTDLKEKNLELARRYGATHAVRVPDPDTSTMRAIRSELGDAYADGFDVVVPGLLEGEGMIDALDALATSGRIVMYGCIGVCHAPFDFFKLHRKRGSILSTEPRSDRAMRDYFDRGVGLVSDGLVNTEEMITDILPLERVQEAFALRDGSMSSESIHVLVDCENASDLARTRDAG